MSKHEINVGFVNSLPEKWLGFSQGLRNANHIQSLDLADIYGRFVYEDNLINRRYHESKKAITYAPIVNAPLSTVFFSNNVVQDFQEDLKDEMDIRTYDEYLNDLNLEFQERALLANSKRFITRSKSYGSRAGENTEFSNVGKMVILPKIVF